MDDDAPIIAAAQAGEADAWQALYARYQPSLWGFFRCLTRGAPDLADYCQETWLHVARDLGRYEHRGAFWAWLSMVARHVWIAQGRRAARRVQCVFGADMIIREQDDPADSAIQRAFARALIGHLSDPRDREILYLRIWHDLTWSAIGARYGISSVAVLARYARTIRELRAYLALEVLARPKARRALILPADVQEEAARRHAAGEMSIAALAAAYGVSAPTMKRYLRQQRKKEPA